MVYEYIHEKITEKLSEPLMIFHLTVDKTKKFYDKKCKDFKTVSISGEIDINGASELRDVLAHLYHILKENPTKDNYKKMVDIETELMYEHIRKGTVETMQNCVKNYYSYLLDHFKERLKNKNNIDSILDLDRYSSICENFNYIQQLMTEARRLKAHRDQWLSSIKLFEKAFKSCVKLKIKIDKLFKLGEKY